MMDIRNNNVKDDDTKNYSSEHGGHQSHQHSRVEARLASGSVVPAGQRERCVEG